MEGTPLYAEESEEEEKSEDKLKKPENLGFFAVESDPDEPSALEKAWAETKREPESEETEPVTKPEIETVPAPGTEIKPETPETPPPEAQLPVPEEVIPAPEPASEPQAEITPEPQPVAAEAAPPDDGEEEESKIPEMPPLETAEPAPEATPEPPAEAVMPPPEPETVSEPEPEAAEPEPAPAPQPEIAEPEPAPVQPEAPAPAAEVSEEPAVEQEAPAVPEPAAEAVAKPEVPAPEPEADAAKPFEFSEDAAQEEPPEPPRIETAPPEPLLPEQPPAETEPAPQEEESKEESSEDNEPDKEVTHESYQAPAETSAVPEEDKSSRAAEENMKVESAPKGPLTGRRVETLGQAQLLSIADEINIDGNNLRHIYETHLIGERGLRRLVEEYENGGDMREALKREMLEHQIDFERDPIMRDLASPGHQASDTSAKAADDQLIDRLLENSGSGDQPYEENLLEEQSPYRQDDRHSWQTTRDRSKAALDALFIAVISVLILLVVFVYLSRH